MELLSYLSYPTYCPRCKGPGLCSRARPSALVGRVAIARHHGLFGFSHRNFFPHSAGGWQSKAKEPTMLPPLGLPGLAALAASLFGQLGHLESLCVLTPSSKDASDSLICCCCLVANSYLTLCDPVHRSPPGSSIHGILQARTLEWVAISFSRGSSWSRITPASPALAGRFFTTEPLGNAGTLHQP